MTDKKTQEVAKVAEAGLPAELMQDMEQDAGRGISDNPNDVGLPFIGTLNDLSPQVKPRDEKYIEGAVAGMLFNSLSGELYPHGVAFLPVYYESCHVEWVPRDAGGGFVSKYPYDTPKTAEASPNPAGKGPPRLPNGNDLVETRYWYGFFRPLNEDGSINETVRWEAGVIAYSSTGLKVSRDWVGQTKRCLLPGTEKVAPLFSHIYKVVGKLQSNASGEWFLPVPTTDRWVNSEEYAQARTFADQAEAGAVKVSQPEGGEGNAPADEQVL